MDRRITPEQFLGALQRLRVAYAETYWPDDDPPGEHHADLELVRGYCDSEGLDLDQILAKLVRRGGSS